MTYSIIGQGYISKKHEQAIETSSSVFRKIVARCDPCIEAEGLVTFEKAVELGDTIVICSPPEFHREQSLYALDKGKRVLCEKPAWLPWEPPIEHDNFFVSMPLRFDHFGIHGKEPNLDKVAVRMVRDEKYMNSWKGNGKKTGGPIHHLFIHYIDLAILNNIPFEGIVSMEGDPYRRMGDCQLPQINIERIFLQMYYEMDLGNGVRGKDLLYLHWVMGKAADEYGYEMKEMLDQVIII